MKGKTVKILKKLNNWANSWSTSQLVFLFAIGALLGGLCVWQTLVIRELVNRLQGL